jgi:hypothetical protein
MGCFLAFGVSAGRPHQRSFILPCDLLDHGTLTLRIAPTFHIAPDRFFTNDVCAKHRPLDKAIGARVTGVSIRPDFV